MPEADLCQRATQFSTWRKRSQHDQRHIWPLPVLSGLDVFVLVNDWNIPPYVLRLRSAQSGPAVSLSPNNLTFNGQVQGTTSAAQTIALTNTGNASLTVTSITPAGNYAETDNCITSSPLAPTASCTIAVTFTPLGLGSLSARSRS